MHLKIPPVVVAFLASLFMYILAEFLPVGYFDFTGRVYLMYILLGFGGLIGLVSLFQFFIKKTTVNPININNSSVLVVNGVYKFTRNPMYLALLLFLLAWGLFLGNAFNVLLAAFFVSYMNAFQIKPEEEVLVKLFGVAYSNYMVKVRRWF
tara:strand:+ start:21707 stop:22159 length:453 start_codon:yes stop_codon:yes gene_type:complete